MAQNIAVSFKVSGGELSSYLDQIQKKSDNLTNSAIKSALSQSSASKEQLKIINEQIAALEKKNKLEDQAKRSIALEQRDNALNNNKDYYDKRREQVENNSQYDDKKKEKEFGIIDKSEQSNAQRIKNDYRENLTVLKEQERQQKLQTALSREQIQTAKEAAREQVKAISNGDKTLSDVYKEVGSEASEEEKLTLNLIEEQLQQQKKKEEKEKGKENLLGALLKTDLVRSAGGMLNNIPNAKNELDFVKPMTSLLGMAIGGAIGSAIDLATGSKILGTGVGQTQAGVIGAEIGKVAGEFIGSSLERAYKGREELTNRNFALQALTGVNYGVDAFGTNNNGLGATGKSRLTGNLSKYGMDYSQTADLEYQLAQRQGNAKNLYGGAENTVALEKGLGVSREAVYSVIELQRSATKENKDFLKTISGVLNAGKNNIFKEDRTFLSEFLGKFSTLQKELLKTQGTVATGTTMDILTRFNAIGGQFSAQDPRSMGLLTSLNNSLVSPNTDFKKSLSYYALRQQMPNANIADVIQEQQKGMNSEKYMQSMFKLYGSTGDDVSKRLAFADMFGGNVEAGTKALRAWQGGKLRTGANSGKELSGLLGANDVHALGASQVGQYTRSSSEIQNEFVDDVSSAVKDVGVKMKHLFGSMLTDLEGYIVDKIKGKDTIKNIPRKSPVAH